MEDEENIDMLLRSSRPSRGDKTFMETTRKKITAKGVCGQNEVQRHTGNQKARQRSHPIKSGAGTKEDRYHSTWQGTGSKARNSVDSRAWVLGHNEQLFAPVRKTYFLLEAARDINDKRACACRGNKKI